jgi:hypothetical protein
MARLRHWAAAYPGLRQLELVRQLGEQGALLDAIGRRLSPP